MKKADDPTKMTTKTIRTILNEMKLKKLWRRNRTTTIRSSNSFRSAFALGDTLVLSTVEVWGFCKRSNPWEVDHTLGNNRRESSAADFRGEHKNEFECAEIEDWTDWFSGESSDLSLLHLRPSTQQSLSQIHWRNFVVFGLIFSEYKIIAVGK